MQKYAAFNIEQYFGKSFKTTQILTTYVNELI